MGDRDVEQVRSRAKFVSTLRRVADAIEAGTPLRIQVAAKRFVVPASAVLSIEHEAAGGEEELELQLKWTTEEGVARPTAKGKARRAKRSSSGRKRTRAAL